MKDDPLIHSVDALQSHTSDYLEIERKREKPSTFVSPDRLIRKYLSIALFGIFLLFDKFHCS